jgi:hypothetical protein
MNAAFGFAPAGRGSFPLRRVAGIALPTAPASHSDRDMRGARRGSFRVSGGLPRARGGRAQEE